MDYQKIFDEYRKETGKAVLPNNFQDEVVWLCKKLLEARNEVIQLKRPRKINNPDKKIERLKRVHKAELAEIKKYIHESMTEAWDKIGDSGDTDYVENATSEELVSLGKFLAMEGLDMHFFDTSWASND